MKITYKNTLQDIIDLNLYILNNSSLIRNILKIWICYIFIFSIVGAVILYMIFGRVLPFYIVATLLIFILSIILIPKLIKWRKSREVTKIVNEDKSKNMIGNVTLTLDDKGITRESDLSSSNLVWKVVQKVSVTEKHIFIFINTLNALVIPLEAFDSITEKDSFLQFVNKNIHK